MIERFLKSDLQRRRWRLFKSQKRAVFAGATLLVISFFSFTAELWANGRPIVLQLKGQTYFPVFKTYHPTEFGIHDRLTIDYRAIHASLGADDWMIWPLVSWGPFESNTAVASYPSPPSADNWFGTDDRGRDVFARLLYGFRYSMIYALAVWLLSTVVAIIFGGIMGYAGSWVDLIGQRVVEVLSTVPVLFLLIILVSIFEPSLAMLVVLTSFFGWIGLSYYIRAEFLKNRKREFVESARAMGGSHARLIFRHILPNSLIPVVTFAPFMIASHVYGLAALDYLGFGLAPPTPSWGELLNQAQKNFTVAWWLAAFPSGALFGTLVLLALLGDGFRTAYDPKK